MKASEAFELSRPGGVSVQDCLDEIDRIGNQSAQLREALQGVTKENEGMRDALCQVRDIARNCLQGSVPTVAQQTFGLPIKTMLAIACASLDSIQSQTAGGKGDK